MAKINGTNGDDGFWGTERADQIKLFGGNDWADGWGGNDSIGGGAGDDYLSGGAGNDRIWGAEGNDSLFSTADADEVVGFGTDFDYLSGGPGNDYIGLFSGQGHAVGGSGNDFIIHYGGGAARADGGTGDDRIINNNGTSTGGAGNDRLEAWLADPEHDGDVLLWQTGRAFADMTGGTGADTFAITGDIRFMGSGAEVRDFHSAEGDKLALGIIGFGNDFHGTGEVFGWLDQDRNGVLSGADSAVGGAVWDDGSGITIGLAGSTVHVSGVHALDWGLVV